MPNSTTVFASLAVLVVAVVGSTSCSRSDDPPAAPEMDAAKRAALARRFQGMFVADLPVLPLLIVPDVVVVPKALVGFDLIPGMLYAAHAWEWRR